MVLLGYKNTVLPAAQTGCEDCPCAGWLRRLSDQVIITLS